MSHLLLGKRLLKSQVNNIALGRDVCRIDYMQMVYGVGEREGEKNELMNMTHFFKLLHSILKPQLELR